MTLTTPQPLGKSVLHTISMQAWRRGLTNFYSESIPFSFSTGQDYAKFCVQLFKQSSNLPAPPTILEIGAGNGIFAKQFLQQSAKQNYNCNYI